MIFFLRISESFEKISYLHKQSLCDSMNSLFFQRKSQILVFILKVFNLINNQLLRTASAKHIKTDYSITNST